MNEVITISDVSYVVENIETGINTISFTVKNPVPENAEAVFRDVKSLTVGNAEGEVYGEYPNVEYKSLTITADGEVIVAMHILSETEKQIRELQISVAEHDEVIAQMLYGEVEHNE